jgi:hypothetical protein
MPGTCGYEINICKPNDFTLSTCLPFSEKKEGCLPFPGNKFVCQKKFAGVDWERGTTAPTDIMINN